MITMNASEFKKLTNKTFATNIRQLGWKGSGFHFYKIDPNHIANISDFREAGWAEACAVRQQSTSTSLLT